MFLDHTQRRSTVGRTPLDEWSALSRDVYLTTNNTHNRQISMPPVGFEPTISAGERSQTYALDRAATGTGQYYLYTQIKYNIPRARGGVESNIRYLRYSRHLANRLINTVRNSCPKIANNSRQLQFDIYKAHTTSFIAVCTVHCINWTTQSNLICRL